MVVAGYLLVAFTARGKAWLKTDSVPSLTLPQCIDYAMVHQPGLQRANVNVSIAQATNQIALSSWLPQVNVSGNLTHYLKLPTSLVTTSATTAGGSLNRQTGVTNTANPGLSASQALFSPDLLYAVKSAPLYTHQARQVTDSVKIYLISAVSKSFYSLLLTMQQINILKEDTARLNKNLSDTYHQYQSGLVDETDYEEADITLSNSVAQLKQASENVVPQYAQLKQYMGYPAEEQFNVLYDTLRMVQETNLDTLQRLVYEKRIEVQEISTQQQLQQQLVNRYRYGWIPTVSAFYTYNDIYQNNTFSNLFQTAYPNSLIGLSLSFPVFTGFSRLRYLRRAKLQEKVISLEKASLRSAIYTEYSTAMASYKSNLYTMQVLKKNTAKAKRVYFVVKLQYQQGIIPYLNVITAESNLISSEIGYINALFQVLSSKIDVQKATGTIIY